LILTKPKNSLLEQYKALLSTEAVTLEFEDSAIHAIAHYAQMANEKTEDIGARRLHTVIEKVLEEISFNAHLHKNETITVTKESVNTILSPLVGDEDLARYIP
jgi:ATP-dependent HslUV protease ATP-binding subunit HslU